MLIFYYRSFQNKREKFIKKFSFFERLLVKKGGALPIEIVESLKEVGVSCQNLGKPQNN